MLSQIKITYKVSKVSTNTVNHECEKYNPHKYEVCPFLLNLNTNKPFCKFGLSGKTKEGKCSYYHPCIHFLRGNCKMPDGKCKFDHVTKKDLADLAKKYAEEHQPPVQTTVAHLSGQSQPVREYKPAAPPKPMTLSFREMITGKKDEAPVLEKPVESEELSDDEQVSDDETQVSEEPKEDLVGFTQIPSKLKGGIKHTPRFPHVVCKYFLMLDPFTQHHKCKYGVSGVNEEGHCPCLHPCFYFYTHGRCDMPKGKCRYPHVSPTH